MVVLREDGTCDYWALHKGVRGSISERVTYFAFDLLYKDGEDLRRLPFLERKELLRKALEPSFDRVRYVEHLEADGPTVWGHAHKINVEGIVSKRVDFPYRSAVRRRLGTLFGSTQGLIASRLSQVVKINGWSREQRRQLRPRLQFGRNSYSEPIKKPPAQSSEKLSSA